MYLMALNAPCTLNRRPRTLNPEPSVQNLNPHTANPKHEMLKPEPQTGDDDIGGDRDGVPDGAQRHVLGP